MMRTSGYFPGLLCEEEFSVLIYHPCLNLKGNKLKSRGFLPLDIGLNDLITQGSTSECL